MYPIICKIGPITLYSYGLMMALAFAVCLLLLQKEAKRQGFDFQKISDLAFWALLGGIIGGRIFYVLLNWSYFVDNPAEIIMLHHGGLVWFGGLLFGFAAVVVYSKKKKLSLIKYLDLFVPYIALGQAIGRIGCFLNGCCFGKPVSWGIYFPLHGMRLHPVQLYSVVSLLIIFLILRRVSKRLKTAGSVIVLYFLLASLERFIVEFFRGDSSPVIFGLTVFQLISLFIFASALYASLYLYSRKRK